MGENGQPMGGVGEIHGDCSTYVGFHKKVKRRSRCQFLTTRLSVSLFKRPYLLVPIRLMPLVVAAFIKLAKILMLF